MNIENKRQVATILLAVGLGLVASMLMSKVVSDKVDEQTKIIAKEYQGRSSQLVKEMDIAKKTIQQLSQRHDALAQKVAQQPLTRQQIAQPDKPTVQKTAFSLRTPPGKRALTIQIQSLSAVGGLVNPGDFVDIIAHLDVSEGDESKTKRKTDKKKKDTVTSVLFQNLQVLAVGTNYDPIGTEPAYETQQKEKTLNVTLAVSPEEAGLLTFAQTKGELQLSLRSPVETDDKVLQRVASWDALADFVLEHQGTELHIPGKRTEGVREPEKIEEVKPYIQIFRGGREK